MPTDFTHISTDEIKGSINASLRLCDAYDTISFTGCQDCKKQIMFDLVLNLYRSANKVRSILKEHGFETDDKALLEIT